MQVYREAASRRRLTHRLRVERLQAQARGRRTYCCGCEQRRLCAQVDPLTGREDWLCLQECWAYQLGLWHGELAAARTVRQLVGRELDRVFDPAAAALQGWPRYVCDGCGDLAPPYTRALQLREEHGWREFGRDAHLCATCAEPLAA